MGVFTQKNSQAYPSSGFFHYLKRIGVSVLFSGGAIGVSHVVQATRAGGGYGFALVPLMALCLFLKYPAFLFGPLYTHVTGQSVIQGYLRINRLFLFVVGLAFISIMFTVVAAVSMLSAGILIETFRLPVSVWLVSVVLLFLSTLATHYLSFEKFQKYMKSVFLALIILTVSALLVALLYGVDGPFVWSSRLVTWTTWATWTKADLFFVAALVGWMPAGLDLPMMHSQWLLAGKSRETQNNPIEDFNFGYISTAFLALVFLLIGAVFFFGQSVQFSPSAGGFSKQLLDVYRATLGSWVGVPIGLTLFLAIYSTLIVIVDGFPRVLSEVIFRWKESQGSFYSSMGSYRKVCSWVQAAGATFLLTVFVSSLTSLVDFATVVSFVLAPLFAFLNHRLTLLENFTQKKKVSCLLRVWSAIGILSFSFFAIVFFNFEIEIGGKIDESSENYKKKFATGTRGRSVLDWGRNEFGSCQ